MAAWIAHQGFQPWQLIAVLTVLYMILGCFIDGISMVVLTSSVILPSVKAAGIDLLWFGIFIVLVVEMSLISPPVGLNLFIVKDLAPPGTATSDIVRGALPYVLVVWLMFAAFIAFPQIVLWLPSQLGN